MFSQALLLSVLVALAEARFGQEQVPIPAIQALSNFGQSGQAATLAGNSISTLLASADPCDKLSQADLIVSELGTASQVIAAARGLAGAEQNFNPFVVSIPTICGDPTLPTTAALRGVVPLVDPSVGGSALENANSATSETTPFSNTGLSVAQIMIAHGFSNFTSNGASGASSSPAAAQAASSSAVVQAASSAVPTTLLTVAQSTPCTSTTTITVPAPSTDCSTVTTTVVAAATSEVAVASSTSDVAVAASTSETAAAASTSGSIPAGSDGAAGVAPGLIPSTIAGLDFGLCTPTMKFEPGLDGRSDTEFTFQAQDPLINKGQEEALNPNIITNKICDQLTNVCNANAAAKSACATAKAQILALGTKDASTADAWNTALGFAGTNLNPENAPQPGLIGHD